MTRSQTTPSAPPHQRSSDSDSARRNAKRTEIQTSAGAWAYRGKAGHIVRHVFEGPLRTPKTVQKLDALPLWGPRLNKGHMSRECEDSSTGEAGLTQLLSEMRSELLRFMLVRQCDPAEVEDLLQDLYVKLSSIRTGPVSNPRAYLYQMANNLLHNHRRGSRRQQARDDQWARNQIGPDLEKDARPSPEESAIARDELERVNEAIAQMPDRTAQILRMYRVDGVSQKDIANSMGLSLSAVEKHLQRAYRKLLLLREDLDDTPQVSQKEADDGSLS